THARRGCAGTLRADEWIGKCIAKAKFRPDGPANCDFRPAARGRSEAKTQRRLGRRARQVARATGPGEDKEERTLRKTSLAASLQRSGLASAGDPRPYLCAGRCKRSGSG